jgi:hypothetical protein
VTTGSLAEHVTCPIEKRQMVVFAPCQPSAMRPFVLAVVAFALVLGACSSDADSDTDTSNTVVESRAPDAETPGANRDTSEAASCGRFPVGRTKSLATGARRGVTIDNVAYASEVGADANGYLAVAVTVMKGGQTDEVVLAAPVQDGNGLTLATDSALPYFNWGDMAVEGSPVDDMRDAVGNSDAAQEALACL